jgi:hypothetical protein
MNTSHANVPNPIHAIAHASAVKAASSATGMSLVPAVTTAMAPTPRSVRSLVLINRAALPLSIGGDVSYLAEGLLIGMRDDHVRGVLDQMVDDADDLRSRFAGAKDNFGKALAGRSRVIDASIADVFVVQITDPASSISRGQLATLVGNQQLFNLVQIHLDLVCRA